VFKRIPFFKLLALAQLAMLARQHFQRLNADERRRLVEIARHPRGMSAADRTELKGLVAKMEPGAFAGSAAKHAMPFGRRR
jgi:ribosomal protein L32E